jgi:hypothetical protein
MAHRYAIFGTEHPAAAAARIEARRKGHNNVSEFTTFSLRSPKEKKAST